MYRVLHIMGCSDVGGISTVVLNNYKCIDRNLIQFDIALKTNYIGRNAQELKNLGAKVYFLPLKSHGIREFEKALCKILQENKYDAIHDHEGDTAYIALRIAKKQGVPQRIVHAHSANPNISFKGMIRRRAGQLINEHYATNLIGCGEYAAQLTFGESQKAIAKTIIIPNGIDTKLFQYNEDRRKTVREELALSKKYVIGMIGRLSSEKNHQFALDIIQEIHKSVPECVLLLVGEGEERKSIELRINKEEMQSYVRLLGNRNDIYDINQAIDINILPSIREGLPISAVESMAAGVPVILSDNITKELKFGEDVKYIPLSDRKKWIQTIISYRCDEKRKYRDSRMVDNGYDINVTAKKLQDLYLDFCNTRK